MVIDNLIEKNARKSRNTCVLWLLLPQNVDLSHLKDISTYFFSRIIGIIIINSTVEQIERTAEKGGVC